jgi:hypothetical protein
MARKVGRSARVEIVNIGGELHVETIGGKGLRIVFEVDKSLTFEANRCNVSVWNLSKLSRDRASDVVKRTVTFTEAQRVQLRAVGNAETGAVIADSNLGIAHVRLLAGYGFDLGLLFDGDTERITHERQPVDWISHFDCGDSVARMREATIVRSYAPGTPVITTIVDVAHAMGVLVLPPTIAMLTAALGENAVHAYGFHAAGDALPIFTEMMHVLRTAEFPFEWSIQDGQLVILSSSSTLPLPPVEISEATGLVGRPRRLEAGGVEVISLLDARLQPGQSVALLSTDVSGAFRVERVRFTGDTWGDGMWIATLELRDPLEGILG